MVFIIAAGQPFLFFELGVYCAGSTGFYRKLTFEPEQKYRKEHNYNKIFGFLRRRTQSFNVKKFEMLKRVLIIFYTIFNFPTSGII